MFFVVDSSISPSGFLIPREYQSGSPFSVSEAILRDGCPPHDGQSAARAAVVQRTRDKRILTDDTVVPSETPGTIFPNPGEGCRTAFIDALFFFTYIVIF